MGRPEKLSIPFWCEKCDAPFFPRNVFGAGRVEIHIAGEIRDACPTCGTTAGVTVGGPLVVEDGVITALWDLPPDALRTLAKIADDARKRGLGRDAVLREAAKEVPAAASFLERYAPKDAKELAEYLKALAMFVAAILAYYATTHRPSDKEQLPQVAGEHSGAAGAGAAPSAAAKAQGHPKWRSSSLKRRRR